MLFKRFKRLKPVKSRIDREKIGQIVKEHSPTMLYIAKKILNQHSLAEDAVSESFERIIHNIDKIEDIYSPQTRAYITIIVRSVSIDMLRKLNKHEANDITIDDLQNIADSSMSVLDELTSAESYEALVRAIDLLPDTLRIPIHLLAFEHLSYTEIAKELDISYDAVKMRISRAKKEIKKFLEERE